MKNKIISIGFILILTIIFFLNILSPDKEISISERRKLEQFPEISADKIYFGETTKAFETYTTDQFLGRDFFRKIKTYFNINILRQKDTNNLFEKDGAIYKIEYPLNEKNIVNSTNKINSVYNKYLKDMNVYYSIIPDKNYYLKNDDHLKLDFTKIKEIMNNHLQNLNYIEISDCLNLDDYYKTDLHWKQENLNKVVNKIENDMGLNQTNFSNYTKTDNGKFYGAYYGQLGINVSSDTLYILSNDKIENCTTYNYETKKENKVYDTTPASDKYDIFLSGATALITITNSNATTKKELLLFRDSFSSSLAPLLIENYSKITLIDLRYINEDILDEYIDFNNQDVLFLYSSLVLNNSF